MNKEKLLIITMEECGELTRACSKVLRHKKEDKHLVNLKEEIADVLAMLILVQESFNISHDEIVDLIDKRMTKMEGKGYK